MKSWGSNRKGRSQIIPVCRWSDPVPERQQILHQKTLRFDKHLWQSSRIQNQHFLYANHEQVEKEIRNVMEPTAHPYLLQQYSQ
jgi:hypothetical protein